ncbi:SDR family NAD(P)-dependent oxidoreductase [Mycolicibacterium brisbanense]|uniref:Short-chain alcohol dehydrogenase n=1 Tax=Mycolicibacterium brisbanense TaxID=146020 RepID=A0A100VY70_9MYCO|nr:SDR family oxidoreductase [Mycolicibacterium brisbanense]MCV7160959.1 SDR family oxidoreductase [Mycolicibacterium brisbanense]GAS88138.1 short-chain alcohol dehydrogenase [Mycolicibacterium brisbanense]
MRPRVAVVTGAASGIGAAISTELADHGWLVAGLDLRPGDVPELSVTADISDADQVREAIGVVHEELGPIDALVTAAGYYEMVPISNITAQAWTRMLRVHLGGLRNTTCAVLPEMRERHSGAIVAITSELAIGGGDGDAHYAAAKGAIIGFVRSLATEVAADGIRVNAVAPGPTDTPLLAADSPWRAPDYLATLPAGRLCRPDEVAQVVQFLIDESSFCTGEVVSPNSGAVI